MSTDSLNLDLMVMVHGGHSEDSQEAPSSPSISSEAGSESPADLTMGDSDSVFGSRRESMEVGSSASEKIVYTKDFLMSLQFSPPSMVKPDELPDLPNIICDKVGQFTASS